MKKRHSLTLQIMLMICVLAAGAVLVCWILNSTFLERYYVMQKKTNMTESFQTLSNASADNLLQSEEFDVTFDNMCANNNMTILVISADGVVIRSSAADMDTLRQELLNAVWDTQRAEVVQDEGDYQIYSKNDARLNSEYLILVGALENGEMIMMRTSLESMRVSAEISSRFLLIVALITIAVSSIVGGLMARRFTRPILQLTNISRRMMELDFDAKYVRGAWKKDPALRLGSSFRPAEAAFPDGDEMVSGNEIDLLGDHMNYLSETLEQTISELKSANASLKKDIEKKTQIDEMRKEFLSNVSHELKTPLALIQGYAEGLQECINDDEESRDFYCEVIIDEADKMNRMVKKLLTLNQLEFGNDQVVMERFDITELVTGMANASRILMEKQGISLDMDDLREVYVWGDEFKVEEVVTNYLSNAINHCEGEKIIRIFYTQTEELLRVSVFNTGKPIPEEDIDQIWDKFYKVDKARTREYGGSGIGLSIVKAIMDSFGQSCGVINHEDGVEFWMELSTK
ncbi:MAG: cell wall metabolism sensor histidine kinase WalK [Lachnospiraceae bacterium]|nr:cell wall metabolism sensor histidine kinase WalK [Lachnospiraceae bacterium]